METTKVIRSASVTGARKLSNGQDDVLKRRPVIEKGSKSSQAHEELVSTAKAPETVPTYQPELVESLKAQVQALERRVVQLDEALEQSNRKLAEHEDTAEQEQLRGYKQGYREGVAEAQHEYQQRVSELTTTIKQCQLWLESELVGLEAIAADVVLTALVRIVGEEYARPEFVVATTRQVAQQIRDRSRMTIRVNKRDHEVLVKHVPELSELLGAQLQIQTDSRIQAGGCLIETDAGTLDGRLDTQIKLLQESILAVVRESAEQE